jgi:hypothetical protein
LEVLSSNFCCFNVAAVSRCHCLAEPEDARAAFELVEAARNPQIPTAQITELRQEIVYLQENRLHFSLEENL